MQNPLVTCLCLTRDRRDWLPAAIRAFERQSYHPRELLILADSEQDGRDLVPAQNSWICFVVMPRVLNVGEKRNAGIDCSAGAQIICHWDDDDWSNPERIADQVERLAETGKAVTGYHSAKFTNGRNWWRYEGAPQSAIGSSLCYRREWWRAHPIASRQIGQDEEFAAEAWRAGQLASVDAQDHLWTSVHERNTSRRVILPGSNWREIDAPASYRSAQCGWPVDRAEKAA